MILKNQKYYQNAAEFTNTEMKKVNFETLPVVKKYFLKKENEALAVSFQTGATATF